jgi:outer membrane protein TolC
VLKKKRTIVALAGAGLFWCLGLVCAQAPELAEPPPPIPKKQAAPPETLPPPKVAPMPNREAPRIQVASPELAAYPTALPERLVPITLPAALQLAELANLDIAQAREVVNQARAVQMRANATALPTIATGALYNHHEGQIQKTEGNIETINRDSLWVSTAPIATFQLVEAIYNPLIARRLLAASQAGLRRTSNDTMFAVADAYFTLLRARRRIARIDDTMSFLASDAPSPLRAQSRGLLPLVRNIVEVGGKDAFRSDLERVRVEILRRQEELAGAYQDLIVASAELARLLHLDPEIVLFPAEDFRVPMPLAGDAWTYQSVEDLVRVAMSNRPELAENQALVEAALQRVRTAKYRPLMPTLAVGYNWGGFGGGPSIIGPTIVPGSNPPKSVTQTGNGSSGHIDNFDTRTEFDAAIVWRLQNLGFGNLAEVREQQALYRQAQLRQIQIADRVIAQVVQADQQVLGWRRRVDITRASLFGPNGELVGDVFQSLRLNFERIRGAEGRPLEVLDSIRSLNDLLEAYGSAMSDYERARFRLLVVVGIPPVDMLPGAPKQPPPAPGQALPPPEPAPR